MYVGLPTMFKCLNWTKFSWWPTYTHYLISGTGLLQWHHDFLSLRPTEQNVRHGIFPVPTEAWRSSKWEWRHLSDSQSECASQHGGVPLPERHCALPEQTASPSPNDLARYRNKDSCNKSGVKTSKPATIEIRTGEITQVTNACFLDCYGLLVYIGGLPHLPPFYAMLIRMSWILACVWRHGIIATSCRLSFFSTRFRGVIIIP